MNSELGLVTLKSTAGYLGIRAQLKTYKYAATQKSKVSCSRIRREDLGSLGFIFFFFFSSFYFFSLFRSFRVDYFLVFLFSFYFWIWMLSFELKLNAEFDFFSNYYLECLKFRQISGI